VHRRFLTCLFKPATRKLDELVASGGSIELPNSFIAAIVFYYICGNDFIANADDFTMSITGYNVAQSAYIDLLLGDRHYVRNDVV
jgi:hypothetical protein